MSEFDWERIYYPSSRKSEGYFVYDCAHCGKATNGVVVAAYYNNKWLICPECGFGSIFTQSLSKQCDTVYPAGIFGPEIEGLPDVVLKAYQEARNCMSTSSFTACELVCRKILMNVAVDKGADKNKSFVEYIDYLEGQGYITPPIKGWVDLIRKHGNLATHEIEKPDKKRAECTIMFTIELLRLIYEMDFMKRKYVEP